MTFEAVDANGHGERFPGLKLAWAALRAPSGTCAILNAANEVAVAAFLDRRIRFDQIHHANLETLAGLSCEPPDSLGGWRQRLESSRDQAYLRFRYTIRAPTYTVRTWRSATARGYQSSQECEGGGEALSIAPSLRSAQ